MTPTLIDTSVLVRWIDTNDPEHGLAIAAISQYHRHKKLLCVARQCLYEFWVVATRPVSSNGLGSTPAQARVDIENISALFPTIPEPERLYEDWLDLVTRHAVSGRPAHDARLAALMKGSGIKDILTFNGDDFKRYPGVTPRHPKDV